VGIVRTYGVPCVVSINRFPTDSDGEIELLQRLAKQAGAEDVVVNEGFARGGEGAIDLATAVVAASERPGSFSQLTPAGTPIRNQIETIARRLYGADGVDYLPQAERDLERMDALGIGDAPVCMAKTHLSLSHDPTVLNRPTGFRLPVRQVVANAGAGFVVVLCGDMQRMPGLGRTPNFVGVDIDEHGRTVGLF
jgi:formyltetrahydrofolate synthetase